MPSTVSVTTQHPSIFTERDLDAIEIVCLTACTRRAYRFTVSGWIKLSVLPLSNRQRSVWPFTWTSIMDLSRLRGLAWSRVIGATVESGEKLQAAEEIEDSGPCWSLSAGVGQNGGPHGSHAVDDVKDVDRMWSTTSSPNMAAPSDRTRLKLLMTMRKASRESHTPRC